MKKKALITALSASLLCAVAAVTLVACGDDETQEPAAATKYTVTYAAGATTATGDAPTEADHAAGEKFNLKANTFTNTGYGFSGWTFDNQTYAAGTEFTMPEKNVTFTAKWSVVYTIGFEANETEATLPNALTLAEGTVIDLSECAVTLNNYVVTNWTDGENYYGANDTYTVTGNATLKAILREKAAGDDITLNGTCDPTTSPAPTYSGDVDYMGYWFKELPVGTIEKGYYTLLVEGDIAVYLSESDWYDGENGIDSTAPYVFEVPTTDSYTLYLGGSESLMMEGTADSLSGKITLLKGGLAKVAFTNGGQGPASEVFVVEAGETLEELPETPSYIEGYIFEGWVANEAPFTETTVIKSDLTVTAKWSAAQYYYYDEDENTTLSVLITLGDKDPGTGNYTVTLGNATVFEAAPTKEGYTFTGWEVNGTPYDFGATLEVTPGQVVNVEPAWTGNDYNVTYVYGDYADSPETPATAKCGDTVTLPETLESNDAQYGFAGWEVKKGDDDVTVEDNEFTMPAGAVTVTAKWARLYDVTFVYGDHATSINAVKKTVGATVTLPEAPDSNDAGYEFDGWEVKQGGDDVTVVDNEFTMPAGDVTVTAKWTEKSFNVTYVYGDYATETALTAVEKKYGATVTLPANLTSNNAEYKFDGWEVKQSDEDVTVEGGEFTMPAGDVTITAKWARLYTVNVYLASGDTTAAKTVYVESGAALGTALDAFKTQKGITSFAAADSAAVNGESVVSSLVSTGEYELKVYPVYTINVAQHGYNLNPDWKATLNKGEVVTLKGTQGATGAAAKDNNWNSLVLYLYAGANATDGIRSDWCLNPASGKTWADDAGNLADGSALTALVGPDWNAGWKALIADCDITVVADWSNVTVIYLAMTFTKGNNTQRMIYSVQPVGETYTFGLGTDLNSFNITSVNWKPDETVASADQTSLTVGTSDCTLAYTAFNPVWVSEKLNAGDKLVISGDISLNATTPIEGGFAPYKVPIINFMQNNYSIALWRVDGWANGVDRYGSVAQGNNAFNSTSWGTDANKSGTFVLTFDWTSANSLVVTIAVTVDGTAKTNVLTLTNPNVNSFSFGLGGEGVYMTSSSIVYTRAQA